MVKVNSGYLESKYKEPRKTKSFNFNKYSDNAKTYSGDDDSSKQKFNLKNIDFKDERNEIDPIQTDTTDSKYLFNNSDAIVVNLKKKKNK